LKFKDDIKSDALSLTEYLGGVELINSFQHSKKLEKLLTKNDLPKVSTV
jgi:hypothetical protein